MNLPRCRRGGALSRLAMLRALPYALVALLAVPAGARADWRDPIAGGSAIRQADFEVGVLTVHASRHEPAAAAETPPVARWSLPLVDRKLDAGVRAAPIERGLIEAIARIEPIYDPTLLEGPNVIVPMRVYAGTAEMRDVFADRWRVTSTDPNVDREARPLASVWSPGATPPPCSAYRVRRAHEWGETALSAATPADCRVIQALQAKGFTAARPLVIAIAAPSIPVFAAPEPGSRMSSADFWAAQRARIAGIHDRLHRKWVAGRAGPHLRNALN